jgi:hypothetical protein
MTETTTKSAARLLTEAAGIAGFPAADGWPLELLPGQLAGLMAGCRRKDDPKRYDVENRLIATGIKDGKLQTVTVLRPPSLAEAFMAARLARVPGNSGWVTNWQSDAPRRIERIKPDAELREVQAIERRPCATWLDAIGEPAGEYVRAWLGPEYEAALKVSPGNTASIEKRKRSALIGELQAEWPTIERDLRDASRNGLAQAAKLKEHGYWCKVSARKWAEENGKLIEEKVAQWFDPLALTPKASKSRRK